MYHPNVVTATGEICQECVRTVVCQLGVTRRPRYLKSKFGPTKNVIDIATIIVELMSQPNLGERASAASRRACVADPGWLAGGAARRVRLTLSGWRRGAARCGVCG